MTASTTYQQDGRKWSVDSDGIKTLRRRYRVQPTSGPLSANGEDKDFTSLPSIGSSHPFYSSLVVQGYEVSEGTGASKNVLDIDVVYGRETLEVIPKEEPTEEHPTEECEVLEWGWDDGTEDRELIMAADNTPVLNSAGDQFDRVPTYSAPSPTFTKVIRTTDRRSAMSHHCKVNNAAVTIGGVTYGARTLLCSACEKLIIGDPKWRYQYTIRLRHKSHLVYLNGTQTQTECGWDAVITDAGMRERDSTTGLLKHIVVPSQETGEPLPVSSPELLNGAGEAITRSQSHTPEPYNIRFQAYPETTLPTWFYTEPTFATPTT